MSKNILFQTALDREPRNVWNHDPSAIVQLHADPEPDYMDTFASGSIDPETALLLKEEYGGDNSEMPAYEYIEEALENTAPTTENIRNRRGCYASRDNQYIGCSIVELTELLKPFEDALHAYPYPSKPLREQLQSHIDLINKAWVWAYNNHNIGV